MNTEAMLKDMQLSQLVHKIDLLIADVEAGNITHDNAFARFQDLKAQKEAIQ